MQNLLKKEVKNKMASVIEHDKAVMLAQLIQSLEEAYEMFEKAYNKKDKKRFDNAKSAILEIQNQVNTVLSQK